MLKVNKNHVKGNFDKHKGKFVTKTSALFLSAYLFSGACAGIIDYAMNAEKVATVSEEVRHSIYYDNSFVSNLEALPDYKVSDDKQDMFITEKTLSEVLLLDIDMNKNDDFSFLNSCDKLQELIIRNAQMLKSEDIQLLASFPNIRLHLFFDALEVTKRIKFPIDVNILQNRNVDVLFSATKDNYNEVYGVALYYFLKGMDESFDNKAMSYDKFQKIDKMLKKLLSTIDLTGCECEEDKLLYLAGLVTDFISYDEAVDANLDKFSEGVIDETIADIVKNYNQYPLSSLVEEKETVKGICINYASLLAVLCQKCGIEAYCVTGDVALSDLAHAWNLIKVDGDYKYVDTTLLDSNAFYQIYWDHYRFNDDICVDDEYEEQLRSIVARSLNAYPFKYYYPVVDIKGLQQDVLNCSDIVYYNEKMVGKYINRDGVNMMVPVAVGFGSSVFVVAIYRGLEKNKKMIRKGKGNQ